MIKAAFFFIFGILNNLNNPLWCFAKQQYRVLLNELKLNGEMAEWSNAVASKAIIPCKWNRGFESLSLLQPTRKASVGRPVF